MPAVVPAGRGGDDKYQDLGRALQLPLVGFTVSADVIQPIAVGEPALHQYGACAMLSDADLKAEDGPGALDVLRSEARIDLLATEVGLPAA